MGRKILHEGGGMNHAHIIIVPPLEVTKVWYLIV